MQQVGTAELKNNLSVFLKKTRQGGRFIVTDRGVPVAKLVPIDSKDAPTLEEKLAGLSLEGVMELSRTKHPFKTHQKITLSQQSASQYVIEDRQKGW